jgi:hypothetical protein
MMKVVLTDIFDKDGNLIKIDVHDLEGQFVIQIVWDENDEQTSENRKAFREWANRQLKQRDYEPV